MTKYDYVIIGGGVAGVTAAETIRGRDSGGSIALISDEPHLLYSRVLLPAYLKNKITRDKLFLRRAEDFTKQRIDLFLETAVTGLDFSRKEVSFANRELIAYKKLLVSAGGRVKPWGNPEDQDYVYRLQTLDDADRLYEILPTMKRMIVVGASFISLEFLEIFAAHNIPTTLLARDKYFFERFCDPQAGALFAENFSRREIQTEFNDEVQTIVKNEAGLQVQTKALKVLSGDALAVGVGIDRNIELFRDAGVGIAARGIRADETLRTNQEDVWTAGDVAEYRDAISGKDQILGNWTGAFLQGAHAGREMTGVSGQFRHVPSYSTTNLGFQITAVGDVTSEAETVVAIDAVKNKYARFFIRDNALGGAMLINRFHEKPHLTKLIETRRDVSEFRDMLRDPSFDTAQIPLVELTPKS